MYVCTSKRVYEAMVGAMRIEVVLAHVLDRSQALDRHAEAAETRLGHVGRDEGVVEHVCVRHYRHRQVHHPDLP